MLCTTVNHFNSDSFTEYFTKSSLIDMYYYTLKFQPSYNISHDQTSPHHYNHTRETKLKEKAELRLKFNHANEYPVNRGDRRGDKTKLLLLSNGHITLIS
jgi:hypothetical protein